MSSTQEAPRTPAPITTKKEEVVTSHLSASAGFGCAMPCSDAIESVRANRACPQCNSSLKPG